MEMAAKAVGKLALASGTYTAEYVEFEVKRSFEWLTGDRNEGRRYAAVSGLNLMIIQNLIIRDYSANDPMQYL